MAERIPADKIKKGDLVLFADGDGEDCYYEALNVSIFFPTVVVEFYHPKGGKFFLRQPAHEDFIIGEGEWHHL